ncbi:MAG: ATP-grasp domain-containing protein [Chloroflexota bacterium]
MAHRKKDIVVAVTGLNAIDSPGPGIAVIRAVKDIPDYNIRIIGLAYEALEPGIYMRDLVDKTYQIPYPSAGTDALFSRIGYINEAEHIDVLIPNFDAELYNFIRIRGDLEKIGIHTFLPSLESFEARDKINLNRFGRKHGLPVPEDKVITSVSEIRNIASKFGFPIVVKGKFYDAIICNTIEQAEKAFFRLQAKWGVPVIIQEYISGTEMNIAVLGDGKGNAISIVPMRKLYITENGKAWAGITIDEILLTELARKFVDVTKWRGGCEIEVMMTSKKEPVIMEVNPRFPAWIYLTAGAGQNQPAALLRLALGQQVEPYGSYEVGKMFIRYSWDMIVDISEFHKISGNGEL